MVAQPVITDRQIAKVVERANRRAFVEGLGDYKKDPGAWLNKAKSWLYTTAKLHDIVNRDTQITLVKTAVTFWEEDGGDTRDFDALVRFMLAEIRARKRLTRTFDAARAEEKLALQEVKDYAADKGLTVQQTAKITLQHMSFGAMRRQVDDVAVKNAKVNAAPPAPIVAPPAIDPKYAAQLGKESMAKEKQNFPGLDTNADPMCDTCFKVKSACVCKPADPADDIDAFLGRDKPVKSERPVWSAVNAVKLGAQEYSAKGHFLREIQKIDQTINGGNVGIHVVTALGSDMFESINKVGIQQTVDALQLYLDNYQPQEATVTETTEAPAMTLEDHQTKVAQLLNAAFPGEDGPVKMAFFRKATGFGKVAECLKPDTGCGSDAMYKFLDEAITNAKQAPSSPAVATSAPETPASVETPSAAPVALAEAAKAESVEVISETVFEAVASDAKEIEVLNPQRALSIVRSGSDLIATMMRDKILVESKIDENGNEIDGDYGRIAGSKKACLYKSGAEKLCHAFGLCPIPVSLTDSVSDWNAPFFYFHYRCEVRHIGTGLLVATANGSCNSKEDKYGWRWVNESQVPNNLVRSTLQTKGGRISELDFAVEKAETSGKYGKPADYWNQFKAAIEAKTAVLIDRTDSKGTKRKAWEIDATMYRIPNPDVYSIVNTLDKMAQKRALVAAVLIATAASRFFTQDIEDIPDFGLAA